MKKKGTLKKKGGPKGDQKTHFGPLGDQSPPKGTNVGAVHYYPKYKIWTIEKKFVNNPFKKKKNNLGMCGEMLLWFAQRSLPTYLAPEVDENIFKYVLEVYPRHQHDYIQCV